MQKHDADRLKRSVILMEVTLFRILYLDRKLHSLQCFQQQIAYKLNALYFYIFYNFLIILFYNKIF